MNGPCKPMQDRIADLVLGLVDQGQKAVLLKHIESCPGCRQYLGDLERYSQLFVQAGKTLETDMAHRQEKVIQALNRLQTPARTMPIWRRPMISSLIKIAAAAIVVVTASVVTLFRPGQSQHGVFPPLLASALAQENVLFMGQKTVHIQNEITVHPSQLSRQMGHSWIPMCSLKADGQFRFDQLKLPAEDQAYTVTDQAWYDPPTGRFVRLLKTDRSVVFGNSYDGEFVYTSEASAEGKLQVTKALIKGGFQVPQKPAEFLGLAAGMPSGLDKTAPWIISEETGRLDDGTAVHIFKSGLSDPNGRVSSYWLFMVRDDDKTIAESRFVLEGQVHITLRRVLNEQVDSPEHGWDLADLAGIEVSKTQATVTPDMVISDVSIKHMVEKADFETYVFNQRPAWTEGVSITDVLEPTGSGKRMFIFACKAADKRHVVLVQSPLYNTVLGQVVKQGTPVYTSPSGFQVIGGGRSTWMAGILLQSAQYWIKDPPADDRVGYILVSPARTYPALAINGPVTDAELKAMVDSLVPAKGYLTSD